MAALQYFNQIQQLYVAYFGRPADPEGLSYWAAEADNSNGDLSSVIANFSISAESSTLFANLGTEQMVTSIYANTFNRAPEAAGLAYWTAEIESGAISKAQAAWTILQSAGAEDTKTVQNKLVAANAFTDQIDTSAEITGYAGAAALAQGRAFLKTIDGTAGSIDNLQANAAGAVTIATGTAPAPPVQTLTFSANEHTGVVSFSGSATGDISVAWSGTVGDSEATFSRGGHDATPISFGSGAASSVTLAASETLVGSASTLAGLTVNGTGTVKLEDTAANLSGQTFAATSTTNDVLTVTYTGLPGASTDLTKLTGFETIHLQDNSPFTNTFTIADGAGTTINAVGSVGVTLGTGGQVFNGSAYNDIVMGGTGNDTINSGQGFNLLLGGGGNDTFNIAAASNNSLNDLNTGDALVVAAGGAVTANGVSAFVATSATVNNGTVQIKTFLNSVINLSLAEGTSGYTVIGGDGNDTITGSAKNDLLTGGAGNNNFVMTGVTTATNGTDTITDFKTGTDKIQFSLAAVNMGTTDLLLAGALTAANFASGPGATPDSASSHFSYDTTTGTLTFDADGNGAGAAVALVTLTGAPTLVASDIVLSA